LVTGQNVQHVFGVAIFKSASPLGEYQRRRSSEDKTAKFDEII
jgi:hypothetical protein